MEAIWDPLCSYHLELLLIKTGVENSLRVLKVHPWLPLTTIGFLTRWMIIGNLNVEMAPIPECNIFSVLCKWTID